MRKYEVTYTVTGHHTEIIEVDDDMTAEEVQDMCYDNFPPIEEYQVEVDYRGDDEDEDFEDEDEDFEDEEEERA